MDNDLTINSLSFVSKGTPSTAGSERRETSRGVNLPEVLTIRNRDYVDSKSKLAGHETVVRVDRYIELSAGGIAAVDGHIVLRYPKDTGVESADLLAVINRLATLIAGTTHTGLDLGEDIFVNQEQ